LAIALESSSIGHKGMSRDIKKWQEKRPKSVLASLFTKVD